MRYAHATRTANVLRTRYLRCQRPVATLPEEFMPIAHMLTYILNSTFLILHSTFYILHSTFYILHS
ncbi:hypothetical protein [Moorena sp. SIO3I8]|nr:hypothetical protein [Moorena sp. SIO3I8]